MRLPPGVTLSVGDKPGHADGKARAAERGRHSPFVDAFCIQAPDSTAGRALPGSAASPSHVHPPRRCWAGGGEDAGPPGRARAVSARLCSRQRLRPSVSERIHAPG